MKPRSLVLALTLTLLLPSWARAQGVRFRGVVTDEAGEPLVGAVVRVQVIAQNTSISGSGKSKKDGRYGLFVMQPARQYRITVTKEGFKELVELFDSGSSWTKENLRIERDFQLARGSGPKLARIPGDVRAIYNKGVEAFNERDWDTARKKFENTLAIRPRLVPAHLALAETCFYGGDSERALVAAKRALELDDGNREAIELLVKVHRDLGNDSRAGELERTLEDP